MGHTGVEPVRSELICPVRDEYAMARGIRAGAAEDEVLTTKSATCKSLDGADPAQHASLPPLRPAPDDGERYRDGRVRSPGPGAPDDQLVDPWNAAEAGA